MSSSAHTHRRAARLITAGAIIAGLGASGALVWHASYSAFAAQTTNPTSNWSAGTVALSDDDNNTAMFSASGLKPGSTDTKCIAVTSTGSLAAAVKLYGTNPGSSKDLAKYINLSIKQGDGGGFGSCDGFTATGGALFTDTLDKFGGSATNYATGLGDWAPTGKGLETRVYQISYTLSSQTPDTAQGGGASIGLTWESQNS